MKRKSKLKTKPRTIIGFIIIVASFILAGYVGIWEMFIGPIIDACKHFDAGTLTGLIVGKTVLKCVFATTVSSLIVWFGYITGITIIK